MGFICLLWDLLFFECRMKSVCLFFLSLFKTPPSIRLMHSRPLTNSSWYLQQISVVRLQFPEYKQTDFIRFPLLCDELKATAIDSGIYFWWKIQILPPELSVAFPSFPHCIDFLDMFDKLLTPGACFALFVFSGEKKLLQK